MNSVNNAKNINATGGHQYNWQHMIFVTKYRYKMFRKSKTVEAIRKALYDVAERYKMTIKELSFGDDYSHVHLEVSVPNTMSISYAVQLLKGYSVIRCIQGSTTAQIAIFQRTLLDCRIQQWKCWSKR